MANAQRTDTAQKNATAPKPSFTAATVNATTTPALTRGSSGPSVLRAQVMLDRAGFGPGVLDGGFGMLMEKALRAYQQANGLTVTGKLDAATWGALPREQHPPLVRTAISGEDAAGPFVAKIPTDMMEKAKLKALHYTSIEEALAEKFHTTPAFLKTLNPAADFSRPGTLIWVPNVRGQASIADGAQIGTASAAANPVTWEEMLNELSVQPNLPKAARVIVDKSDTSVRAVDKAGKTIAFFPATIGSEKDPLPIGKWTIKGRAYLPPFHYNPDLFWDADSKDEKTLLPAGPNSPVGVVWIDLSKKHYGIHGTPEPQNISRTESHGCIRLSNWDAARLATMVDPGTPAILQE
ncbi:L,D-transpeptidase family protein [Sphingoaurantiacus capsulatus]|uniref:L,D-transpeptidase family protein n=1 Tax=Sphingoaurantiacus capsulatus TaxID=1771310 RepID=A0ABV7XGW2_9SPHN